MRMMFLVLPVLALVACDDGGTTDPTDTTGADGAAVYSDNCAVCHAADGSGGTGPALDTVVPGKTASDIEGIVRNGSGSMVGFSADVISDEESAAVADYVVAEWGD